MLRRIPQEARGGVVLPDGPDMPSALERAIVLLTDGKPVDWEGILEDATDTRERALIEELRGLAELDSRVGAFDPAPVDATLAVSAPGVGPAPPRWAHLELLDEIGHGASGTVYRAWDTRLAREVALKLIANDGMGGSIEEARRLARVSHPNVVSIYGADRIDGQLGLWMELLRGQTLDEIIRDRGPFSARETVAIALDVCGAVAAIHRVGLVHRDIKAQNVMREPGGRLVLMDLGASIDASRDDLGVQAMAGTPLYMAPELFEGAQASVQSDVYALGVLLYRLVTVEFPVHAHTIGDVRRAHATGALRPLREVRPNLPPGFVDVVDGCLADDVRKRFSRVAAVDDALRAIDRGVASITMNQRRAVAWAAATAIAVGGITWGAFALTHNRRLADSVAAPATTLGIPPDQYKMFAGYEELAFNKREDDPSGAAAAVSGANAQIHSTLTGNHPIFGFLYAQLAHSWRRAGNLRQAGTDALDGAANMLLSVGEDHPYTALLAMELARNAQAAGNPRKAAEQVLRALDIRWRVLGLSEFAERHGPLLDAAALERNSRFASTDLDSDGDGLLDLIELTAGLNPHSMDSDRNGVLDDDEQRAGLPVSNRLALGLMASPFLSWAHYGAQEPRYLAWQSPERFPMVERPDLHPSRWSIEASHGQGYFTQRLARAQSLRAMEFGFSLLLRAQPIEGAVSLVVDTAPVGPRFDLIARRIDGRSIELGLLTSVVPREGPSIVVDAPVGGPGPLLELRYRPQWKSAALYVNGHPSKAGYTGHHQFQDPLEGGVAWAVMSSGNGDAKASASFNLVWLEIF